MPICLAYFYRRQCLLSTTSCVSRYQPSYRYSLVRSFDSRDLPCHLRRVRDPRCAEVVNEQHCPKQSRDRRVPSVQSDIMPKTLIPPPPPLEHHSPIESALSLTPLAPIGPDIFTNARPLWHPPGARGIFGGAAIAQCLSAAMATVDSTVFTVHSMHCYFVLAGDGDTPVVYYVERVRDGKSFVTRTVQARQRGKVIL
jgi:hypothetical protein